MYDNSSTVNMSPLIDELDISRSQDRAVLRVLRIEHVTVNISRNIAKIVPGGLAFRSR